ncbi:MAG: Phage integrase [Conexibacter sp.]|nr:Phage integrase [Conexibacter sp.]
MQEAEERRPRPAAGERHTVDDAANSLRSKVTIQGSRKSYLENCESMQRVHISPRIGSKPVDRVTTAQVEVVAEKMLEAGLAPKSVRNLITFLHSGFEHAIDKGWAAENPVRRAARPKRRRSGDVDPDLQFLTLEELDKVLGAIPDEIVRREPAPTRRGRRGPAPPVPPDVLGPVIRVIVLVAAATGLRQSELLGLRWRDVDWEVQRIRVRNAFVRGEHSGEGTSHLSTRRSVPMADLVVAALKAWSERTPYCAPDDLVFAHPQTGRPVDRSKLSRRFKEACPRCRGAGYPLPRSAAHVRDAAGGFGAAAAVHPRAARACGREDDADLRALRAFRARGRDGQRGVREGAAAPAVWSGPSSLRILSPT